MGFIYKRFESKQYHGYENPKMVNGLLNWIKTIQIQKACK